jgi:undecaprenyl-diphosphatase
MAEKLHLYLSRMHALDTSLCLRFNRTSQYRLVRWWFRLVSRLGDGVFWYAVMLGIVLAQRADGLLPCLHMLAAGLAGTAVYKAIKAKASRPRPFEMVSGVSLCTAPLDRFSFPSGHTLHAVAFSAVALGYYPALAWLLVPFTVLVGVSRLVLGLHYPSDVLAGAAIGGLIAKISFALL